MPISKESTLKKCAFIIGCFVAGLGILGAAFSLQDEGHWESVEDFSGTVSITRTVDWETVMPTGGEENVRIIAKDNSYASILVKRTLKDGPYIRPVGLWSGYINAERSIVGASSGGGVKESFSGQISREYGADCAICGPHIKINKKRRLYKMSFTCPKAEGERTRSMVPSGQVESHSGSAEICPHIPEPYREGGDQGACYDPSSGIIMGSYSVTCYGDSLHDGSEAVKEEGDIFLRGTPDPLKCPIKYTVTWTFSIKKFDYKKNPCDCLAEKLAAVNVKIAAYRSQELLATADELGYNRKNGGEMYLRAVKNLYYEIMSQGGIDNFDSSTLSAEDYRDMFRNIPGPGGDDPFYDIMWASTDGSIRADVDGKRVFVINPDGSINFDGYYAVLNKFIFDCGNRLGGILLFNASLEHEKTHLDQFKRGKFLDTPDQRSQYEIEAHHKQQSELEKSMDELGC